MIAALSPVRAAAQVQAASVYASAVGDIVEAGREVRRFRWKNAHLLALEAKAMIELLDRADRVSFRRARINYWRNRYRRFAAKAYALDHVTAYRAGLSVDDK